MDEAKNNHNEQDEANVKDDENAGADEEDEEIEWEGWEVDWSVKVEFWL